MSFPNPVTGVIHPAEWVRPTGNLDFEVTSPFGPRVIYVDGVKRSANHGGLDIGNGRAGWPVLSQGAGKVVEARPTVDGVITVQSPDGLWRWVVAHMTNHTVGLGATVSVGQNLGRVGNIGVSSAAHLHFENKKKINGVYVAQDPWPLLAQNQQENEMTITITKYTGLRDCSTKGGTLVGYRLNPAPLTKSGTFAAGSGFHSDSEYAVDKIPAGWPPGPYQRVVDGFYAGYLLANSQINLGNVPSGGGGFTQADVDAARKEGANQTAAAAVKKASEL